MPICAPIVAPAQQPCIHCGDCSRACPQTLDPEALFFALVSDEWPRVHSEGLNACTECNRCVEVCPSHIPLLDWLRWGKSELREHARADAAHARFLARDARLARGRRERTARRNAGTDAANPDRVSAQTISKSEVLAAIARGRAKRRRGIPR